MPEASIPGDRNPKNSFDDVVRELQEIKDNDEQYSNDNTELLLQIDDTLQKTSDSAMSQRNVINNIMQYQTELFGKLSDFAEMNNKAMLDQAENLKKLSETPKEKKDDKGKTIMRTVDGEKRPVLETVELEPSPSPSIVKIKLSLC